MASVTKATISLLPQQNAPITRLDHKPNYKKGITLPLFSIVQIHVAHSKERDIGSFAIFKFNSQQLQSTPIARDATVPTYSNA